MAQDQAARNVIFTLRTERDPGDKGRFKQFVDDAKKAQAEIHNAHAAAVKRKEETDLKYWSGEAKRMDKAIKDQDRAIEKQRREEERLGNDLGRLWRRHETDRQRGIEKTAAQAAAANARISASNQQVVEGLKQAGQGALQLGRAMALAGLVGEKDMARVLNTLLKIQVGFDAFRGSIDLIQGGAKAWAAYKTAVQGAASAQAAMNAVQAGGAVTGVAGGVQAAAGVGVGIAAAKVAAALLALAGAAALANEQLRGTANKPGSFNERVGRLAASTPFVFGDTFFEIDRANRLQQKTDRLQQERDSEILNRAELENRAAQQLAIENSFGLASEERGITLAGLSARRGLAGNAAEQARLAAELQSARGAVGAAQQRMAGVGPHALDADRDAATSRLQAAEDRLNRIYRERLDLAKTIKSEELAGVAEHIAKATTLRDKYRGIADDLRKQTMTARERFGSLTAVEQASAIAAAQAVSGGTASEEQRAVVEGFGLEGFRGRIQQQRFAAADAGGFDQFTAFSRQQELILRAQETSRAMRLEVDQQVKVQVELKNQLESITEQIVQAIRPELEKLEERERRERDRAIAQMGQEERRRQAAQRARESQKFDP